MSIRQHLVAILAADAAGYSHHMAREELGTIAALDAGRDIFKTEIESRQGRVIDMAGDSILASFETAIGAVMAALRIQERLNELAAHLPDDRQMRFRIGVHVGDIREKDDGTIYGDGVNIAARLQGLAEPGGLTISGATQESVRHRLHATFEDLGEQHVKNIPYLVRAFRVDCGAVGGTVAQSPAADATGRASRTSNGGLRPSSTQVHPSPARSGIRASLRWTLAVGAVLLLSLGFAGAAWRWYAVAPTVGIDAEIMNRRAIALLAFSDKRGTALGSTLGEDMADLIAGRLVRDGVRVIGRAATVRQDSAAPEFERIGREQGVRFVLAGRVTRASTRILVDTYLTEIASGAVHRLHEAAFGSDEDAIRSNYASAVTIALNVRFHELEAIRARLPGREKSPVDALALGWHELDRSNTKGELESARARFEFAAAADPKSVEASAGLGLAHLLEFYDFHSASPGAKLDVAEKALKRALELGPGDPTSLAAWADILFLRQKPDEAFWVWRKALEISPEHRFALAMPISAGCIFHPRKPSPGSRIFMAIGEKDQISGVEPCRSLAEKYVAAGGNVTVKLYPGAPSGFDGHPGVVKLYRDASMETFVDCTVLVEPDGRFTYVGKTFAESDTKGLIEEMRKSCIKRGGSGWTNLTQKANVTLDLIEFLDSNFRL